MDKAGFERGQMALFLPLVLGGQVGLRAAEFAVNVLAGKVVYEGRDKLGHSTNRVSETLRRPWASNGDAFLTVQMAGRSLLQRSRARE